MIARAGLRIAQGARRPTQVLGRQPNSTTSDMDRTGIPQSGAEEAKDNTQAQSDGKAEAADEKVGPQQQQKKRLSKPVEPQKPEPEDCCGNGCAVCVWDLYDKACEEYAELKKEYERQANDW